LDSFGNILQKVVVPAQQVARVRKHLVKYDAAWLSEWAVLAASLLSALAGRLGSYSDRRLIIWLDSYEELLSAFAGRGNDYTMVKVKRGQTARPGVTTDLPANGHKIRSPGGKAKGRISYTNRLAIMQTWVPGSNQSAEEKFA